GRQGNHRFPHFLPDGRRFLFFVAGAGPASAIYLGGLDRPEVTRLTASSSSGRYVEPGWLLFVRQNTLVAVQLDLAKETLRGEPIPIAEDVMTDAGNQGGGAFSTSATGLIAYRAGSLKTELAWFDRAGGIRERVS